MSALYQEQCDWVALLLITRPEEGFDDLYERLVRREVERLTPHLDEDKEKPRMGAGLDRNI
jgi:hypothetical protein